MFYEQPIIRFEPNIFVYLSEDHKTSKSRVLIIKQSRVDLDLTINTCFIKAMGLKLLESRFFRY